MTKKAATQPQDKYILRLPDGMRDRIKAAAERNKRSMNAEIVATLEEAYPDALKSFYDQFLKQLLTSNDPDEQVRLLALANEYLEKVEKTDLRVKILRLNEEGFPTVTFGGPE